MSSHALKAVSRRAVRSVTQPKPSRSSFHVKAPVKAPVKPHVNLPGKLLVKPPVKKPPAKASVEGPPVKPRSLVETHRPPSVSQTSRRAVQQHLLSPPPRLPETTQRHKASIQEDTRFIQSKKSKILAMIPKLAEQPPMSGQHETIQQLPHSLPNPAGGPSGLLANEPCQQNQVSKGHKTSDSNKPQSELVLVVSRRSQNLILIAVLSKQMSEQVPSGVAERTSEEPEEPPLQRNRRLSLRGHADKTSETTSLVQRPADGQRTPSRRGSVVGMGADESLE
ncbi:hypothetical protein HD806DRAFT_37039 [Xylariaceae sp. AK1471]|nr:hypothetical protein HD806DRAFT_37039 [Xylariaceae sp. AK1471]